MIFSEDLVKLSLEAESALSDKFKELDEISFKNTVKVMDSFRKHTVNETYFAPTSGYGYGDRGRDTLDLIYADVFGSEAAFVRHNIVNGTQALAIGLYGLLRPGDTLLSVAGKPYDTLEEVIGIAGEKGNGSLADFGVAYRQTELTLDGNFDYSAIEKELTPDVKVVFVQRSKGYLNRKTLSVSQIGELVKFVKARSNAYIYVDNCYGEFVEELEPTDVGVDLMAGSLIKNPGGGMAECGGYLAGSAKAVELASYRLTTVGVGCEVGATMNQNKSLYKGFFYAPHTVTQALKTAAFAAYIFSKLGFFVEPDFEAKRYDIIQMVTLNKPEYLCAFCEGIQAGSPVDAHLTPEPWDMPGYQHKVIMAAGTFTSGASIELSADGPMKEPYNVYFQGALTYESGKLGILSAAQKLIDAMNK
ncbi:MAG: methionine gamma-lyase family protein [Clostridia bacterium]|nr:methionine gamma-lyase family protein [Clostridia bacterium]